MIATQGRRASPKVLEVHEEDCHQRVECRGRLTVLCGEPREFALGVGAAAGNGVKHAVARGRNRECPHACPDLAHRSLTMRSPRSQRCRRVSWRCDGEVFDTHASRINGTSAYSSTVDERAVV